MLPFELTWVKKEWFCHLSLLKSGKTAVSIQAHLSERRDMLPFELSWVKKEWFCHLSSLE